MGNGRYEVRADTFILIEKLTKGQDPNIIAMLQMAVIVQGIVRGYAEVPFETMTVKQILDMITRQQAHRDT